MAGILNHIEYLNAVESICRSFCFYRKHDRHFVVAQSDAYIDGIKFRLSNTRNTLSYMTTQTINLQTSKMIEEFTVASDCQNSLFVHVCKSLRQEPPDWQRGQIKCLSEFAV